MATVAAAGSAWLLRLLDWGLIWWKRGAEPAREDEMERPPAAGDTSSSSSSGGGAASRGKFGGSTGR